MATSKPILNRQQLSKFLPSHEAVKAFEALFETVHVGTPANLSDVQLAADVALGRASAALDSLAETAAVVQGALLSTSAVSSPVDVYTPPVQFPTMGTIAAQNANAVSITGGSVAVSTLAASGLISASGGQIQFPAVQIPSAGVNVLDDYKEGTFTPTVAGLTTPGTCVYAIRQGKFTKIGNVIEFSMHVSWSGHTGTGNTLFQGLPYISFPTLGIVSPLIVFQSGGPIAGAGKIRNAFVLNNSSQIVLYEFDLTTGISTSVNPITPAGVFHFSGKYFVA